MENIPKIIHYCWFGGNKKTELLKKCIDSWKRNLPDYKIIEWNETNFNVNINKFTRDAYKNKKWAFVSDYCRLWVLYKYGGIYLDTDMEVIKPLDKFLKDEAFGGIEKIGNKRNINMAIWGCKKGDEFIHKILKTYDEINFLDYKENLLDLAIPFIITKIASEYGYKIKNYPTNFFNGTMIYPNEYFYPKGHEWEMPNITEETYTIHHYDGSWRTKKQILRSKIKKDLIRIIGYEKTIKITEYIKNLIKKEW